MQGKRNIQRFVQRARRGVPGVVHRIKPQHMIALALTFAVMATLAAQLLGQSGTAQAMGKPTPTPTVTPTPVPLPTPTPISVPSGTWVTISSMTDGRWNHTMTMLQDGRVLVVGGVKPGGAIAFTYEIFNPATGLWTSGATPGGFHGHTATRLLDGRVLIANGSADRSSYLYNPATNSWAQTGSNLHIRQERPQTTLLADGRVLLTGGISTDICEFPCGTPIPPDTEIYDPATGTWSTTSLMSTHRSGHTATMLPDGRVLVAGGSNVGTTEIYTPASGTWAAASNMAVSRSGHSATLLPDGRVLVAGGNLLGGNGTDAELYDPASNTWSNAGSFAQIGFGSPATLLTNGRVLVMSGNSASLYDPATNAWTPTGSMNTPRDYHRATLLGDGHVLVAGGTWVTTGSLASAEVYTP